MAQATLVGSGIWTGYTFARFVFKELEVEEGDRGHVPLNGKSYLRLRLKVLYRD